LTINNKDSALKIAMSVFPELQNKIIYKVSDIKPQNGYDIPSDCWYISYSALDKHCAGQMTSPKLIAISKISGQVMFNGVLTK
jgi:hypothetical protein